MNTHSPQEIQSLKKLLDPSPLLSAACCLFDTSQTGCSAKAICQRIVQIYIAMLVIAASANQSLAQGTQTWDAPSNSGVDNPASWQSGNFVQTDKWQFQQPSIGSARIVAWNDTGGGVPNTSSNDVTVQSSDYWFTPSGFANASVSHTATNLEVINGANLRVTMPFTINDELAVQSGGSLDINSGAVVNTNRVLLSEDVGAESTINIDGTDSSLQVSGGPSLIGRSGSTGTLNLTNGAAASFADLGLADSAVADSSANISILDGSVLTLTADLRAGTRTATGQVVNIDVSGNNSQINQTGAGTFTVGSSANSTATVNITGGGEIHTGSGGLVINRTGLVDVAGGLFGKAYDVNGGTLKFGVGGRGDLLTAPMKVQNGGTIDLSIFSLDHGNVVDVLSGGTISERTTNIGPSRTSVVNVDGGTFDTRNTFTIHSLGTVNLRSGEIESGSFNSSAGTFNHTGGTLIVDGGSFNPGTSSYRTGTPSDTNAANVTLKNGATADISGTLQVRSGDTLSIESGATVNADSNLQIWGDNGRGFVVVEGTGSVLEGNAIGVGFSMLEGRLTVRDGGVARATKYLSVLKGNFRVTERWKQQQSLTGA